MKYLVTGAAGFIGAHLARRLLEEGHEVWVVDNLSTGKRENVPPGAEFLEFDIASRDLDAALPKVPFDAVLHLAAQSSGEISHEAPTVDLLSNVFGTLQLLKLCRERGVPRFVYASSMAVYGLTERLPVAEDDRFVPHSFYGINKLAAEHYVEHFRKAGLKTTVLRMFNVYGPGQNLGNMKQGMVSIYLAYVLAGEPLLVKGSADRFRDFIYIDDVVAAWLAALREPVSEGRVYNLGTGRRTTVGQVITELMAAFGHAPGAYSVQFGAPTPGDQFGMQADIRRIQRELGWEPRIGLSEGIRRMVEWARSLPAAAPGARAGHGR